MHRWVAFLVRNGTVICLVWGFAEATLWFIVPDVAVGALALFAPPRWWRWVAATVVASLCGGLVMLTLATAAGDGTREVVTAVPGISAETLADVGDDLDAMGGSALVRAPLSGVPYKVFAVEMGDRSWGIASFLGWSLPARLLRILPMAGLAAVAGRLFRGFVARRLGLTLTAYVLLWLGGYVAYFRAMGF